MPSILFCPPNQDCKARSHASQFLNMSLGSVCYPFLNRLAIVPFDLIAGLLLIEKW